MQVQSVIGIENLKNFASRLMSALRLDRNGDGQVSTSEIAGALLDITPELFNLKDELAEIRDLDGDEFAEIMRHIGEHFPDYAGVNDQVEEIVRQALVTAGEITVLVQKIHGLRKKDAQQGALPVTDGDTGAKKDKMSPEGDEDNADQ